MVKERELLLKLYPQLTASLLEKIKKNNSNKLTENKRVELAQK